MYHVGDPGCSCDACHRTLRMVRMIDGVGQIVNRQFPDGVSFGELLTYCAAERHRDDASHSTFAWMLYDALCNAKDYGYIDFDGCRITPIAWSP